MPLPTVRALAALPRLTAAFSRPAQVAPAPSQPAEPATPHTPASSAEVMDMLTHTQPPPRMLDSSTPLRQTSNLEQPASALPEATPEAGAPRSLWQRIVSFFGCGPRVAPLDSSRQPPPDLPPPSIAPSYRLWHENSAPAWRPYRELDALFAWETMNLGRSSITPDFRRQYSWMPAFREVARGVHIEDATEDSMRMLHLSPIMQSMAASDYYSPHLPDWMRPPAGQPAVVRTRAAPDGPPPYSQGAAPAFPLGAPFPAAHDEASR